MFYLHFNILQLSLSPGYRTGCEHSDKTTFVNTNNFDMYVLFSYNNQIERQIYSHICIDRS